MISLTVINASEESPEKNSGSRLIQMHDLCDVGGVMSEVSYQIDMRAVGHGLSLYMGRFRRK